MQSSFAATIAFTKAEEGGYTASPLDTGNWTGGRVGSGSLIGSNMGVGAPALCAWLGFTPTAAYMKALPEFIYTAMANASYWRPLNGDALPVGLDLCCFDFCWNTGVSSAGKRLQGVLGAQQDGDIGAVTLGLINTVALAPLAMKLSTASAAILQKRLGVTVDGEVGLQTLTALATQSAQRVALIVLALGNAQETYYRSLSAFPTFGAGWLARTARRVSASLALIDAVA